MNSQASLPQPHHLKLCGGFAKPVSLAKADAKDLSHLLGGICPLNAFPFRSHKSKALRCPENIQLLSIPPYSPEMNPIEQIWKQIRSMGFRNEVFNSLDDVMNRLCETICMVTNDMIKSITGRKWIVDYLLE